MPYNKDKNQQGKRSERPRSNAPRPGGKSRFSNKTEGDKQSFERKDRSEKPRFKRSSEDKPSYPRRDSSSKPRYEKKEESAKPKFSRRDSSGKSRFDKKDDAEKSRFTRKDSSSKPRFKKKEDAGKPRYPRKDSATKPRFEKKDGSGRRSFKDKDHSDRRVKSASERSERKPFRSREKEGKDSNSAVQNEGIRLNRYIANAGICSRRDADALILDGRVKVNGKVVKELGTKVSRRDRVSFDGKPLRAEKTVYLLLNKPKDVITSVTDDRGRKTVIDLVRKAGPERVVPVGRLDRNTTGLLLLTNDGELTEKLTHPSHKVRKLYHVTLDKKVKDEDIEALAEGFELEDGFIKADEVSRIEKAPHTEIGILLHSGRNRIVRRMMEHLGYTVVKLDRVLFANLTKRDLPRGRYRRLSSKEISLLKRIAGK